MARFSAGAFGNGRLNPSRGQSELGLAAVMLGAESSSPYNHPKAVHSSKSGAVMQLVVATGAQSDQIGLLILTLLAAQLLVVDV